MAFFLLFTALGLLTGSFAGAVIDRLPRGASVLTGRSHCPACAHALGFLDLIPVLSFLCLRGRCRYCGAPVPARDTCVELINAALWGACALRFGCSFYALTCALYLSVLLCAAFIDLDTLYVPPVLNAAVFVLAVCQLAAGAGPGLLNRLTGLLPGVFFALLYYLNTGIGGGDVKLMLASGFFLGFPGALLGPALAYVLAALCILPGLLRRTLSGSTEIAMIPFFALAYTAVLFAGPEILALYSFPG